MKMANVTRTNTHCRTLSQNKNGKMSIKADATIIHLMDIKKALAWKVMQFLVI